MAEKGSIHDGINYKPTPTKPFKHHGKCPNKNRYGEFKHPCRIVGDQIDGVTLTNKHRLDDPTYFEPYWNKKTVNGVNQYCARTQQDFKKYDSQ